MFSVVNTILLRPLPYRDPSRLLLQTMNVVGRQRHMTTPPDYTYRANNQTFGYLDAYCARAFNPTTGTDPGRLLTLIVSSIFSLTSACVRRLAVGFVRDEEHWARTEW